MVKREYGKELDVKSRDLIPEKRSREEQVNKKKTWKALNCKMSAFRFDVKRYYN